MKSPTNNDWSSQVLQEQEELDISFSLEDIKQMSKLKFKSVVQSKTKHKAFKFLLEKKESRHSKNSKGQLTH